MRTGELTIYEAGEPQEFDIEAAQRAIRMLPGRVAVAPDKPRTSYGLIELPTIASEKERPDCGTVVAVGGCRRKQDGTCGAAPPVIPGERVLLRPCKGKWVRDFQSDDGSFSLPECRFYGVTWDIQHEILAVHRDGAWQPLWDWIFIKRESNEETNGILIANPGNKRKKKQAVVVACNPGYGVSVGDTVIVDDHPNVGLGFKHGQMGELEVVKMIDEDRYRQVWAVLDETKEAS